MKTLLWLPLLALGASSLVACGGPKTNGEENKKPQQVAADAAKAVKAAKSYRISGTINNPKLPLDSLDMEVLGENARGTITWDKQKLRVVKIGKVCYYNQSDGYLRRQGVSASKRKTFANRWIRMSGQHDLDGFTVSTLLDELSGPGADYKGSTKKAKLDDKPIVKITEESGAVLYVADTGAPYPLKEDGGKAENVRFSDFGQVKKIVAPRGARTVDQIASE